MLLIQIIGVSQGKTCHVVVIKLCCLAPCTQIVVKLS